MRTFHRLSFAVGCLSLFALLRLPAEDLFHPLPNGVSLTTAAGETIKVVFRGDRIVHVTAWPKGGREPGAGYVVTMKDSNVKTQVARDADGFVSVKGSEIEARIDPRSGQVSFRRQVYFRNAQGQNLLEERSRTFTPVTVNNESTYQVQQAFGCAPDEALFGFGQHQEGIWNWRGMPIELQQQNTSIAVPFFVSTKGYGVLWDNASRTTVNPVDQEINLTLEDPSSVTDASGQPKATEDLAAKPAKNRPSSLPVRQGTFTTTAAGEYVFFAQNGDRSKEFALLVDDKPVVGIVNMWTPYTVAGSVRLPAKTTVKVTLRGGGKAPTVGARLRETGQTVFRSRVGDAVDYTFFYGPSLDQLIDVYRQATGPAPLLPRWAFGFWQCRERYNTQQELLDAARKYRQLQIPVDLIVQDWQYWGKYGWGAYQFDETKYPDPAGMIKELHDLHIKFMISVWPETSGPAKKALSDLPHGLIGSYYDAYNPAARALRWSFLDKTFFSIGTDAWWQDAAEPGDPGTALYGKPTFLGSGDRDALAYPLFHSQGIYENQRATNPEKRVVNLTRSAYTGQQRYGDVVWSGDVNGDWITFRRQIVAGLNFSLSGQPYWTTDSGGFFRPANPYINEDANEVQARWFEWSTFCPVQRIHGFETKTEFWNWLPSTQQVLIAYDKLRYRLLPYNYSLAWQVTHNNATFMRSLAMDFADDPQAVATSNEYMWGSSFLVTPVTAPKAESCHVYLPQGARWTNFWTGETTSGGQGVEVSAPLNQIPLFLRAGSIVPFGPELQYASEKPTDPIELRIYPGADGAFTLYEDEGDSYRYEQGVYSTIPIQWNDATHTLSLGTRTGSFTGMLKQRTFKLILVNPKRGCGTTFDATPNATLTYDGTAKTITLAP